VCGKDTSTQALLLNVKELVAPGKQRTLTIVILSALLNVSGLNQQTLGNRLHAANIHVRRPAVRPPLTPEHKGLRLKFALAHQNIRLPRLRSVLFTDESKLCVDFNDGRKRVWKQNKKRFRDCCVKGHDRFGGPSVLVCYGISYDGRTDLYII